MQNLIESKAATPSCQDVTARTPQRQQAAASATESSGLIFVSTEPKPLSDGLAELEPVLNSFFCAGTINNDEDDGIEEGIDRLPSVQSKKPATPAPIENPIDAVEPEKDDDEAKADVYESNPTQLTFMQKKLLRLQQEHLSSFAGSSLGEIAKPKLSKLEQEREAVLAKKKAESLEETPKKWSETATAAVSWQAMSFDDAFASAKPRKSRLEREKDLAELAKAKLQAEEGTTATASEENSRYTRVAKKSAKVVADDAIWGNVLKKRSRLEMEKEKTKAKAQADGDGDEEQEAMGVMSKRRKIEQANDYWKQFGNGGDIFGQVVKKKSKLEQEKENAQKARIKESEKELKTEGSKKKGIVLVI